MSKAEQLAAAIVSNTEPIGRWTSIVEAAALLRTQDALLKQALDALLAQQEAIDGVPTGPERQVQWAIDALREATK